MTLRIPTLEPEVIEAAARQWEDSLEKIRTTSIGNTTYRGVDLWSRYGRADEMQTMVDLVDALPVQVGWTVESVAFDSKAGTLELRAECGYLGVALLASVVRGVLLDLHGSMPPVTIRGLEGAEASLEPEQSP